MKKLLLAILVFFFACGCAARTSRMDVRVIRLCPQCGLAEVDGCCESRQGTPDQI